VINRSESQLIARDQSNQILKSTGKARKGTPARCSVPTRKKKAS